MLVLFFMVLPFAEIYSLYQVGSRIGVINTIFALIVCALLGLGIIQAQGVFILRRLKQGLARGEVPANEVLHSVLIFVGGALLIVPGFISDLMALVFILPGTRHLLAIWFKARLLRGISNGQFKFYGAGTGHSAFGTTAEQDFGSGFRTTQGIRDVTPKVIDVTPLSVDVSVNSKPNDNRQNRNNSDDDSH